MNVIYLPNESPKPPALRFPDGLEQYLAHLADNRFAEWIGIPRICRVGPYSRQEIDTAWVEQLRSELQELLAVLYDWRERVEVPHQLTDYDCAPMRFGRRRFCEWIVEFLALCDRALAQNAPLIIAGD